MAASVCGDGGEVLVETRDDWEAAAEEGERKFAFGPHDGLDFGVGVVLGFGQAVDEDEAEDRGNAGSVDN